MVRKDLGMVTAYAYAVSKGYTGTEAEFAELMASYASVAQEAVDAALAAAQSAQAAASARDTAQTTVAGAIAGIQAEGQTQVGNVNSAGATQVGAVQAKGEEVLNSIPADYSTLSGDVTGLKSALDQYINGVNAEFVISETGTQPTLIVSLLKDIKYWFTNNTDSACTLAYKKADGTTESITNMNPPVSGAIPSGTTVTFTPLKNIYVGLSMWAAGTGNVTVNNTYSNLAETKNIDERIKDYVDDGAYHFVDNLIPNTYIATTGQTSGYNGWSCTDFIEISDLLEQLIIISEASNGGNYDSFYNSNKEQISSFPIRSGINEIDIPDGAKYIRLSNTTVAMQTTIIKNIIGELVYKVANIDDLAINKSIYAMNQDESMVANAGANYGFHSAGQSNVQKRFSMLVTTDPHGDATAMKRAVEYINDMPCFDCGCCLGDLQSNTYTDNDGTWYTNAIKGSNKPWLTLVGNHDVGIGKSIATTGNQEQVYNKFIAPNLQYAGVTPNGKSYYYKDFATYKIRLICLNPYDVDNNDTSGGEYVVQRYTEYYSQAQIDWLVSLLANTPSDYHVMILTHNTPKASTKDTSVKFNNKTYSFSPESSQQGIVADIVDAWQRGVSLSHTYPCYNENLDSVTVSADFTSRGTGVFICFLTGHMHVDAIGHITSFVNQNVFTFASTNMGTWQNDWSDLPRADGTKAEDCITALAVDTTNREIYINRIGSSVSRWFTVREPSVISY